MSKTPVIEQWRRWNGPALFEGDFAAWLKSLSPKARIGEAQVHWTDLSPFTVSAYGQHLDLIGSYCFLVHKGKAPATLPDDCTPEGFYLRAVETRRRQIGLHNPFTPTAYERLSAFSHFMYQRMAERIATSAGFSPQEAPPAALAVADGLDDGLGGGEDLDGLDDGLGYDSDDGLGDGL